MSDHKYITLEMSENIGVVTFSNPPRNFINLQALQEFQWAFRKLDADDHCRAIVLAAQGKVFCAGADFTSGQSEKTDPKEALSNFYSIAMTLFETKKPMVAAVQGAAIGAGFGLSLLADFRIACPETIFSANFTRLGIHPGFGMSVTLPRIIGVSNAELLFYTGRRVKGHEAMTLGLLTELVEQDDVLACAMKLANEIAVCAPLAIRDTRATMRMDLAEQIRVANKREQAQQMVEMTTKDFREGMKSIHERREPVFTGS
ncbi:MAG: enoyl-CoA hydratase/carnithine racemase [Polaribacter sp.]|jgi:enoyl-CoA hydratase/carnithine racemase